MSKKIYGKIGKMSRFVTLLKGVTASKLLIIN